MNGTGCENTYNPHSHFHTGHITLLLHQSRRLYEYSVPLVVPLLCCCGLCKTGRMTLHLWMLKAKLFWLLFYPSSQSLCYLVNFDCRSSGYWTGTVLIIFVWIQTIGTELWPSYCNAERNWQHSTAWLLKEYQSHVSSRFNFNHHKALWGSTTVLETCFEAFSYGGLSLPKHLLLFSKALIFLFNQ